MRAAACDWLLGVRFNFNIRKIGQAAHTLARRMPTTEHDTRWSRSEGPRAHANAASRSVYVNWGTVNVVGVFLQPNRLHLCGCGRARVAASIRRVFGFALSSSSSLFRYLVHCYAIRFVYIARTGERMRAATASAERERPADHRSARRCVERRCGCSCMRMTYFPISPEPPLRNMTK